MNELRWLGRITTTFLWTYRYSAKLLHDVYRRQFTRVTILLTTQATSKESVCKSINMHDTRICDGIKLCNHSVNISTKGRF